MDYGICGASWYQYPVDIKGQLGFGGIKSYMWIFFIHMGCLFPQTPVLIRVTYIVEHPGLVKTLLHSIMTLSTHGIALLWSRKLPHRLESQWQPCYHSLLFIA